MSQLGLSLVTNLTKFSQKVTVLTLRSNGINKLVRLAACNVGDMKYTLLKNKLTGERSIRLADGTKVRESDDAGRYNILRKRAKANNARQIRDEVYRDHGMIKTPYGWE